MFEYLGINFNFSFKNKILNLIINGDNKNDINYFFNLFIFSIL